MNAGKSKVIVGSSGWKMIVNYLLFIFYNIRPDYNIFHAHLNIVRLSLFVGF